MWIRSKKSQSPGKAWTLLWAAEPESASAVRTSGGRSGKPDDLADRPEAGEVARA